MELRDALTQIADIRSAVAASERFHGYRAVPVGSAGVLAVIAAAAQPLIVPNPTENLLGYIALWYTVAIVGAVTAGVDIARRNWSSPNPLRREVTRHAVAQFVPCLLAGLFVTVAMVRHAEHSAAVLPGLWQVLFSLGVFASCRQLPRGIVWVAIFYLGCGTYNLAFGHGVDAFRPWAMGLPFGVGQLATAAILYADRGTTDAR